VEGLVTYRYKFKRFIPWITAIVLVVSWWVGVWQTPAFDHDEAHLHAVANEMKVSGDWFNPQWDGRAHNDKPPTFFWMIVIASTLIDGFDNPVSITAVRMPSWLSLLFILACLALVWPRLVQGYQGSGLWPKGQLVPKWARRASIPILAFCAGLFPTLAAPAILFDPVLTACMTQILCILCLLSLETKDQIIRKPNRWESIWLAVFMALAVSIKGLIGLVIPAFVVTLHCALSLTSFSDIKKGLRAWWGAYENLFPTLLRAMGLVTALFLLLTCR